MSSMTGKENRIPIEIRTGTIIKVVTVAWFTFSFWKAMDKHLAAGFEAGTDALKKIGDEQEQEKDSWADATGEKTA
jgi:hypothetical protein